MSEHLTELQKLDRCHQAGAAFCEQCGFEGKQGVFSERGWWLTTDGTLFCTVCARPVIMEREVALIGPRAAQPNR